MDQWFIDWIKKHEGFRAKAYPDKGQFSIGYGSALMPNGQKVKEGDVITEEEAAKLIPQYITAVENDIRKYHPNYDNYPKYVKYALIDQAYRGGIGSFGKSPKFNQAIQEALKDGNISVDELQPIIKELDIDKETAKGAQNRKRRRAALLAGVFNPHHVSEIGTHTNHYSTFDTDYNNLNTVWGQVLRLRQNQNANWVQRLFDLNRETIPNWENTDQVSTHKLAWTESGNDAVVFPLVQQQTKTPTKWIFFKGKPQYTKGLIDYTDPKNSGVDPLQQAVLMGDTVHMPLDVADDFTKLYKEYIPDFQYKTGGKLNYLNLMKK